MRKPIPKDIMEPFLKWAGGKRWLVGSGQFPVPHSYKRYIEPFLGGGAVFFHLNPDKAILGDINPELIHLYEVVRDYPTELRAAIATHQRRHGKNYYYSIREQIPENAVERAARTLYLNRTCWNGLYRVNLKGKFNVPIGSKIKVLLEEENFAVLSDFLSGAVLRCGDFEDTLSLSGDGDFVFVDPPYTVKHNLNGFLKYNEDIFSWSDQTRLRDAIKLAIGRGAAVVVTNADHESVRALYHGVCSYRQLHRASVLAGVANRRGPTTEALFYANVT